MRRGQHHDVRRQATRGHDPPPDQLSLDAPGGSISRARATPSTTRSRANEPELATGHGAARPPRRVAVAGQDQFITRLEGRRRRRRTSARHVRLDAISASTAAQRAVRRRLGPRLPAGCGTAATAAGWRLLHARGVDDASPMWVNDLDVARPLRSVDHRHGRQPLWAGHRRAGAGHTRGPYTEPWAPRGVWLRCCRAHWLCAADGRAAQLAAWRDSCAGSPGALRAFMIGQVRQAMHPALDCHR